MDPRKGQAPPAPQADEGPDATERARAMYEEGLRLAKAKQQARAAALLLEVADSDPRKVLKKVRRSAHQKAALCLSQVQDWPRLQQVSLLAVERYADAHWPHRYLGEALWRLGRQEQAVSALEKALELNPHDPEIRSVLAVVRAGAATKRPKVVPWPARQQAFSDARRVIEQYVLRGQGGERFIGPDTVFMTFGSCFAENLALRLREAGYTVNAEPIGEEINSTYANRYLLDWIARGVVDGPTATIDRVYGEPLRERLRASVEASDVFVMTLGVAPCFFERDTGDFAFLPVKADAARDYLIGRHQMRTTTVAENVANLGLILDSLRRLARRPPRIVLTVSPVPLAATTELGSAVAADCLSKSTLRVACHEAATLQAAEDVIYWPSFEIVRWLGPHFGRQHPMVYGEDDGDTRHVSGWIVRLIIDLFLERYGVEAAEAV